MFKQLAINGEKDMESGTERWGQKSRDKSFSDAIVRCFEIYSYCLHFQFAFLYLPVALHSRVFSYILCLFVCTAGGLIYAGRLFIHFCALGVAQEHVNKAQRQGTAGFSTRKYTPINPRVRSAWWNNCRWPRSQRDGKLADNCVY